MSAALEIARKKRLVFTITTGRSGTEYLARALACFRDVDAHHEPKPTFGSAFRTVSAAPHTAREFWLEHKLPRVARSKRPIYTETSHLVCKGFLEAAVELELAMTWVHLVRPAREVATSLWRLSTIPGRTYAGVKYYLSPCDPGVRLALERETAEQLDDYELCFWYCLEIEARADDYRRRFGARHVRIERIELEALRSSEGVVSLGERLELGPLSALGRVQLAALSGRRVNEKTDRKREMTLTTDELELREQRVRELVSSAAR